MTDAARFTWLVMIFTTLCVLPAFTVAESKRQSAPENFTAGKSAYSKGDYATALKIWRPLAERGDALTQIALGIMYAEGKGVPQDYTQARLWFRKAADQGDADAQLKLGVLYAEAKGVPQDYTQARLWFRKAADQGLR